MRLQFTSHDLPEALGDNAQWPLMRGPEVAYYASGVTHIRVVVPIAPSIESRLLAALDLKSMPLGKVGTTPIDFTLAGKYRYNGRHAERVQVA
jgi:hypothetical protein